MIRADRPLELTSRAKFAVGGGQFVVGGGFLVGGGLGHVGGWLGLGDGHAFEDSRGQADDDNRAGAATAAQLDGSLQPRCQPTDHEEPQPLRHRDLGDRLLAELIDSSAVDWTRASSASR